MTGEGWEAPGLDDELRWIIVCEHNAGRAAEHRPRHELALEGTRTGRGILSPIIGAKRPAPC
jgi:hypothetical protein